MARYTSDVVISFNDLRSQRAVLAEGTVTINQWNGVAFVPTGTVITDKSEVVWTKGLRLQFVVAAGAVTIEEGNQA